MKKVIIVLCLGILLCGCSSNSNKSSNDLNNSVISKEKLDALIEEENYIILDVRTKDEYNQSHIVGSINIPHNELNDGMQLDKDKNILVYCQSGRRSQIAKETLENLGYTVYDLGGINDLDLPKE